MNRTLKLLLLEDDPSDAELISNFLRRSALLFDSFLATDRPEFEAAIHNASFDAILADNALPQFNSLEALQLAKEQNPNAVFILVTGTVSEEFAVDIIHQGADDYILKSNLTRLPSAITQAVEKRRAISDRKRAEEELRKSEESARLALINDLAQKIKSENEIRNINRELRELSSHLQNIREEERIKIARDIHDELGQQLTALKMDVFVLKKTIKPEDPAIIAKFSGIQVLIEDIVKSIRRISAQLRPSILDDLGLVPALEWHSQEIEARHGIKIKFACDLPVVDAPDAVVTGLFRIYQEALTNVVRHARATTVHSCLKQDNDHLTLEIIDDGQGIDAAAAGKSKSFGLLGIKERVFAMKGRYQLKSTPGKGTCLSVSVPGK
jgi:signal transduction histidine kinase